MIHLHILTLLDMRVDRDRPISRYSTVSRAGPIHTNRNLTGRGTSATWSNMTPWDKRRNTTHGFSRSFRVPVSIVTNYMMESKGNETRYNCIQTYTSQWSISSLGTDVIIKIWRSYRNIYTVNSLHDTRECLRDTSVTKHLCHKAVWLAKVCLIFKHLSPDILTLNRPLCILTYEYRGHLGSFWNLLQQLHVVLFSVHILIIRSRVTSDKGITRLVL